MVLLERLSSNNFENFKTLNLERFSKENYDKNFFEYYENEKFFLKIFLKKFVKLFIYNKNVIGYIWYEVPVEIPVRVWSLYVKPEYLSLLSPNILNNFNNTILSYETCDDKTNNEMLSKLGFKKVKPSILMSINLKNYNMDKKIVLEINMSDITKRDEAHDLIKQLTNQSIYPLNIIVHYGKYTEYYVQGQYYDISSRDDYISLLSKRA